MYVMRYLKGTKDIGHIYSSNKNENMESFINFPVNINKLTLFVDAKFGHQDKSRPKILIYKVELELLKDCSTSVFIIIFNGPLHWVYIKKISQQEVQPRTRYM